MIIMVNELPEWAQYGATELKRLYNQHLARALVVSVVLHLVVILLFVVNAGDDTESGVPKQLTPLLPLDSTRAIPVMLSPDTKEGGGGAPDVKGPVGPAQKGHPDAVPDRSHSQPDPKRSVDIKAPNKINPVDHATKPPHVAGDPNDTTKGPRNVTGTRGQNPNGTGTNPAAGSGGTGIGYGNGGGIGGRGWIVAPRSIIRPPDGATTGSVTLRYSVMPNGDITGVTPVKRGDPSLVAAATAALRRCKRRPLSSDVPQEVQSTTITFNFKLD